jgi:hypothetical protein
MKEQDLIDLGFKRTDVSPEEAGDENGFHYYTYDFSDSRGLSLISNSNDEAEKEKQWSVEIFDYDNILFTDEKILLDFINIIKQNTHEK